MRVLVPSPLRSYTQGARQVDAAGVTLADVLADLDRRYPGFRFRMVDEQDRLRPHLRIFLNHVLTSDLTTPVPPDGEVHIVQALSGG